MPRWTRRSRTTVKRPRVGGKTLCYEVFESNSERKSAFLRKEQTLKRPYGDEHRICNKRTLGHVVAWMNTKLEKNNSTNQANTLSHFTLRPRNPNRCGISSIPDTSCPRAHYVKVTGELFAMSKCVERQNLKSHADSISSNHKYNDTNSQQCLSIAPRAKAAAIANTSNQEPHQECAKTTTMGQATKTLKRNQK
ncbi:hypothetical protein M011DRAFT_470528 [Sporormia fimetaria CBS 119925]|uniref:Uncharacterized protein n=1 Tax=Sporormia fimetaria CBS 119925 TaxID=1340428 RepID=A0A6A6V5B8_9PLEO|nr:hypothetical protein M011DRAFT_470528 [Sporormia fimetaria CBS 119925]